MQELERIFTQRLIDKYGYHYCPKEGDNTNMVMNLGGTPLKKKKVSKSLGYHTFSTSDIMAFHSISSEYNKANLENELKTNR
jgi:hypothetical protein